MLLSLDPATRTGVGIAEPFSNRPTVFEVWSWQLPKGTTHQDRARAYADHLVRLTGKYDFTYAAVETPLAGVSPKEEIVETPLGLEKRQKFTGSIQAQNFLWGLHCLSIGLLHALKIPCRSVGVGEWRKAIHGNGRINGQESKRRCKSLCMSMDVHCPNVDAAEAAGILIYLNNRYKRWQAEDKYLAETQGAV